MGLVTMSERGLIPMSVLMSSNRIRSTFWDIVGAHLSLQLCPNGSEPANDPRIERDAIHGIKPNSIPGDEGHYDQLVCHSLPARLVSFLKCTQISCEQ
jgi:hypothetical protein